MSGVDPARRSSGAPAVTFKVAAVQMASGTNVAGNLSEAARLIERAAGMGAQLVVLPEYFPIMGLDEMDKVAVREEPGSGMIQDFLREMARRQNIWLVGGSIPLAANVPEKVLNTCLVFNDSGEAVARYDKIHLFNLNLGNEHYLEARTIEPGNQVVVVDSPFGRIGLAICYDLRFPELFRAMKDVDIIVLPAAFTETTGKMHWEPLVRARHREFGLCDRFGTGRLPCERPRDAWPQHDSRPVGTGAGQVESGFRRGGGRNQSVLSGQLARQFASAVSPYAVYVLNINGVRPD
jgi:predicted amidohydrolase